MSSQAHVDRLARALEQTGLSQAVKTSFKPDQVNVLLRVHQPEKGENEWVGLVKKMKQAEAALEGQAHGFQLHVCRLYFLKDKDTLVYAWNVAMQSTSMSNSLDAIIRVIKGGKVTEPVDPGAPFEVDSMPLSGLEGSHDRNVPGPGKKKGAYSAGTVPIDRR